MSLDHYFQNISRQIYHLLECSSVHLLLGCPDVVLRHPLLDLCTAISATATYTPVAFHGSNVSTATYLEQDEYIRALCDTALQTGHIQSVNQFQSSFSQNAAINSVCIVPLERPAGILGLLLLTDTQPTAFAAGEHLLLKHYLPPLVQQLEQDLRHCIITRSATFSLQPQPQAPDHVQNEFISMIGHELRTPLSAIKGYAVLLQAYSPTIHHNEHEGAELSPARQQAYLNIIMQQTRHLEVLISDLLDISRIHAGRLPLHCCSVDVPSLCQEAVQVIQRRVEIVQEHPEYYTFHCAYVPDLPLAWADPDRVQQVLTNLLDNAVKYSPQGGSIELHVSSSYASGMLSISVRDYGIGIPSEQHSSLFKPFNRLKHTSIPAIPGTGLGLYISRVLVEAMGGTINLSSHAGEGTTITFTLPVELSESVSSSGHASVLASLV